jgi:hypothetical protein
VCEAQQVLDRSRVAGAPLDVQDALGELIHQIARFGPEVFVGVLRHAVRRHSFYPAIIYAANLYAAKFYAAKSYAAMCG